ncbi:hypothetical protein ABT143_28500 [Streptomyces sp. NPDC002033]
MNDDQRDFVPDGFVVPVGHLDAEVYRTVTRWLAGAWPYDPERVDYAPR